MTKSLGKTVWGVLCLFFLIMGVVLTVSFMRPAHATGVDPARIREMRESAVCASF